MPRHGQLRASDADRERAVERLHRAATEGRIAPDELDERVSRALKALTYSELDAVVADLPHPGRERPAGRHRTGSPVRRATVGGWALAAVRANPMLLVVMIPIVAAVGAMLLAAAVTWMTLLAVAAILVGPRHRHALVRHRKNPWALMWSAGDSRRDWV